MLFAEFGGLALHFKDLVDDVDEFVDDVHAGWM
jgi:hypothetical protein